MAQILQVRTGKVQSPIASNVDENILCGTDEYKDVTRSLQTKSEQTSRQAHSGIRTHKRRVTCAKFVRKTDHISRVRWFRSSDQDRQLVRRPGTVSGKDMGMGNRARKLYGCEDRLSLEPCGRRKLCDAREKSSSSPQYTRTALVKTSDKSWQSDGFRLGKTQDQNRLKAMIKSDGLGATGVLKNGDMSFRIEDI